MTEIKELTKCECGHELPTHLLFALNSHTCSCGRHFRVENPKTDKARFVRDGVKSNPFAE